MLASDYVMVALCRADTPPKRISLTPIPGAYFRSDSEHMLDFLVLCTTLTQPLPARTSTRCLLTQTA